MGTHFALLAVLLAACGTTTQTVVVQEAPAQVAVDQHSEVHVEQSFHAGGSGASGGAIGVPLGGGQASVCPGVSVQDAGETRSGRALGMAILQVAARPWVDLVVDGNLQGRTPLVAVGIEAGPRELRIVAAELGYDCTMRLHAQGGRRYAISVETAPPHSRCSPAHAPEDPAPAESSP